MTPRRRAISELLKNGYQFKRSGSNHDIYYNSKIGCIIPLKRHDFDKDDLRYIQKEIRQNGRSQEEQS